MKNKLGMGKWISKNILVKQYKLMIKILTTETGQCVYQNNRGQHCPDFLLIQENNLGRI